MRIIAALALAALVASLGGCASPPTDNDETPAVSAECLYDAATTTGIPAAQDVLYDLSETADGFMAAPDDSGYLADLDGRSLDDATAKTVYDAAEECGLNFTELVRSEAVRMVNQNEPESQQCAANVVTDTNARDYVFAMMTNYRSIDFEQDNYAVAQLAHDCNVTTGSGPDLPANATPSDKIVNDDTNGYFDDDTDDDPAPPDTTPDGGSTDPIERCLEYAAKERNFIVGLLNDGTITEAQYEQMMEENEQGCYDLR